ncbi:acetyl-CoA acetyltransferase [Mycobacterium tuberculosis]|nr:acetyl-CoA acetyltransferase [Mycobacterium tuberculosis]
MTEAYVIDAVRTAVGKRGGALAGIHPVDLGALAWRGLLDRTDIDPAAVDDVIAGVSTPSADRRATSPDCRGWPPAIPKRSPVSPWTASADPASRRFPLARRRSCPARRMSSWPAACRT